MNLDRFAYGPDPAEAKVMAYCEGCGMEIYEGEEVWKVKDGILHAKEECLVIYAEPVPMTVEEALGVA